MNKGFLSSLALVAALESCSPGWTPYEDRTGRQATHSPEYERQLIAASAARHFIDGQFPYFRISYQQTETLQELFRDAVLVDQFLINLCKEVLILSGGEKILRLSKDEEIDQCRVREDGLGVYLTLQDSHTGALELIAFRPFEKPFKVVCTSY